MRKKRANIADAFSMPSTGPGRWKAKGREEKKSGVQAEKRWLQLFSRL